MRDSFGRIRFFWRRTVGERGEEDELKRKKEKQQLGKELPYKYAEDFQTHDECLVCFVILYVVGYRIDFLSGSLY